MKSLSFANVEEDFFKGKNPLKKILAIALDLMGARHIGLLYGTDETQMRFLPSSRWDRGVMDRFDGQGLAGLILKLFGTWIITAKGMSPVFFHTTAQDGSRQETHGIIAYVLRNSADYYKKGINVIICPDTDRFIQDDPENNGYHFIPYYIYDGKEISKPKHHIKVDTRIVRHFKSSNSIYVILPDYGILVINTAAPWLMEVDGGTFVHAAELCHRLDLLIHLVDRSSLAYLGRLKGRTGAELLWRKEAHLRTAYASLAESEQKYRDLYENAPIAYLSVTPEGRVFQCNLKALELSGFSREALMGSAVHPMFPDHRDSELSLSVIWETLKKGVPVRDLELRMVQASGQEIWISLSIDTIQGKDGRIVEMRAMALDISKRKALEKQLFHAQKMEAIGTLARGIAHDFNNLLSPVSGYAQMLLMDQGRTQEDQTRLKTILDCTRHAKELVNQILTFSRKRENRLVPLRVRDAVAESMKLVCSFLPSFIKIQTRLSKDCGVIMADPIQLHQVIMNLVTNSYHAMENGGGVLDIGLEQKAFFDGNREGIRPGNYACLSVSDTGYGIDPEVLPKIFEPYFTTKEEGKGSGIGLSVVHGIVRGHGGEIRVVSEKGRGACFYLYFPVCLNAEPHEKPDHPESGTIEPGTESILLVDDDANVAFMHTSLLERLGYHVTCVTQSLDALDLFSRKPTAFDLVITDYTMPDMNGLELAAEICSLNPGQKVLLCTGLGDELDTGKQQVKCIAGFLGKPIELHGLSRMIRKVLKYPGL